MMRCLLCVAHVLFVFGGGCSPEAESSGSGVAKGDVQCDVAGFADADGDGISNQMEGGGAVDTDGDGRSDMKDGDSDGDGIADFKEAGPSSCEDILADTDGDGQPDFRDLDADGNGIDDRSETRTDIDGDGLEDWQDVDDDGDGMADSVEIGRDPADPADSDGDGIFDYQDTDADDDGLLDRDELATDIDADGRGSYRDDDSDGDGWSDRVECLGTEDGSEEETAPENQVLIDTDGDGMPDCRDLDSDNDGLDDDAERRAGTSRTEADTDGDGFADGEEVDSGTNPLLADDYPLPDPCAPNDCGIAELCGEQGSGDGLDNDCDGEVDEGCSCSAGERRPCFVGPPSVRGQGRCADGLEVCDEFGHWGGCFGGVWPEEELCDGADNDCDGLYDEELEGCVSPLSCPGTTKAAPLSTVELPGEYIYSGQYDSWSWEIFCPPTVDNCPAPAQPDQRDTSVYLVSSGAYRVRATIVIEGEVYTCQFTLEVQGDGLRVELLWDTQGSDRGNTDVDLHLHRPDVSTEWFDSNDDCYFGNCKASARTGGMGGPDWNLEPTRDVTACNEAPHGHGAQWEALGFCANPRLDVDVIRCDSGETNPEASGFCAPENINVDAPMLGDMYRIMVDYYSTNGVAGGTHPTVNVYCGGALRATLGDGDVTLTDRGQRWVVADVVFREDSCGGIDCTVLPIYRDGEYWLQNDRSFAPPW